MVTTKVGRYNIHIVQGSDTSDFTIKFRNNDGTPINLVGYTAALQIRSSVDATSTLDSLTTENDRLTFSTFTENAQTFYQLHVSFPNATTAAYTFSQAVYDLELYSGGEVFRYLKGNVVVDSEVTV